MSTWTGYYIIGDSLRDDVTRREVVADVDAILAEYNPIHSESFLHYEYCAPGPDRRLLPVAELPDYLDPHALFFKTTMSYDTLGNTWRGPHRWEAQVPLLDELLRYADSKGLAVDYTTEYEDLEWNSDREYDVLTRDEFEKYRRAFEEASRLSAGIEDYIEAEKIRVAYYESLEW